MVKYLPMKTAVVYATDENYVKLTAVSICSLLASNAGQTIIVLTSNVSNKAKTFLQNLAVRLGGRLQTIDTQNELRRVRELGAHGYVSFSAYSRLFITTLFGNKFDRLVYLDSDTLVSGSLTPLFELPLHGKPFAIGYDCLCNKYKKIIGLPSSAPYFNSGVLLIDSSEWRHRRCTERILDYMANVRHDFMFGDQDYFSIVLADDATILPPEYNFLTHFQMLKKQRDVLRATGIPACAWYSESQYTSAQRHPVIHHFLGHTLGRPWYKESLNPMREIYQQFSIKAGVPEITEQSRPVELCYRIQYFCWRYLPQPLFAFAVRAMYAYFFRTRYNV